MLKIISIGKLRNYNAMFYEYVKRIERFSRIEIIELKEEKDKNPEIVKKKEGEKILNHIKNEFIIVLDAYGRQFSSEEFSNVIKNNPNICFVIGGANGLSTDVLSKANLKFSISRMTLQHDLVKVVLIEQIYRAFTIIKNLEYHK